MAEEGAAGSGAYLAPRVIQIVGIALLIGQDVLWAFTDNQSAALIGAAVTLIGVGSAHGVRVGIERLKAAPSE